MKPNKRNMISIKSSKKHKEKQRMKSKEVLYRGRFRPLKYICLGKVNFESSKFTEIPLLSTNAALLPNLSTVGCQTAFTQRVRGTAFVKQISLSTYSGHGVQHLARLLPPISLSAIHHVSSLNGGNKTCWNVSGGTKERFLNLKRSL